MNAPGNCQIKKTTLSSFYFMVIIFFAAFCLFISCSPPVSEPSNLPRVLAIESFLADITQNISGDRLILDTLMPLGIDPHSFEPAPGDVAKISKSDLLVINGAGLEEWLSGIISSANEKIIVIEASKGLKGRKPNMGEAPSEHEVDPHFWLDPDLVKVYVQNIRDGLIKSDAGGRDLYTKNANDYLTKLTELDGWIKNEVKKIPEDKRLLVTNHESFGYYADRYGFKVIGTIIPSSSSASSPSAGEIAALIEKIKSTGTKAIFLETGSNPAIAEQVAKETGIKIITELYSHSITEPGGPAPTYIDMMKFNTTRIVESLK